MATTATASDTTSTPLSWSSFVIPLYVAWRVVWANRLPSMDCDEVYNYWEPLHFLLYGTGFQTWEYGHAYGLRTYAYLLPLAAWARLVQTLLGFITPTSQRYLFSLLVPHETTTTTTATTTTSVSSKLILFCLLRASLAACSALAELGFCRALERVFPNKKTVAAVTLWLLLTSAGMAHASSALLPSSTLMILWMVSATCYLQQQFYRFVVVAIGATLAVGWPFGVVLFIPMGLDVLYQTWEQDRHSLQPVSNMSQLLRFIVGAAVVVQATVMVIDFYFYGRWISPIWNILQYNASGGGDELYGVEPLSYYVKNIFLNFNYLGFVAVLALPFWYMSNRFHPNNSSAGAVLQQWQWRMVLVGLLLPLYLWFALVLPRPHKEERFLYPCYPLFCFGAALTIDVILDGLAIRFFRLAQAPTFAKWAVQSAVWFPSTLLSAFRILALSKYYQAPIILYATLNAHIMSSSSASRSTTTSVCTCGEWYRFPSSFYLPDNVTLGLLPSSFRGQLPQPFTVRGSRKESPLVFNDRNVEQHESYIGSSANCQFLVALQGEDCGDLVSQDKKRNSKTTAPWEKVAEWPLLHSQRTRSTLHRAFYLPLWHQRAIQSGHVYYDNYILYERKPQPGQ